MFERSPRQRSLLKRVLGHYPAAWQPGDWDHVEALGAAGGLSGASFWRYQSAAGGVCLRRWSPEHPDGPRLRFIHRVLQHAADQGFRTLPLPVPVCRATAGLPVLEEGTAVFADGCWWELSPWLPGVPDRAGRPTAQRLRAAMQTLARWHRSVAGFAMQASGRDAVGTELQRSAAESPPPAVVRRRELLATRLDQLPALEVALQSAGDGAWGLSQNGQRQLLDDARRVAPSVQKLLEHAAATGTLVPCLRDIHREHLLFQSDQVVGLVDFGALAIDHVACDVARLAGSLVADDEAGWRQAVEAYEQIQPLEPADRQLIRAVDAANTLLGSLNWLVWLHLERRQFDDPQRVADRLTEHQQRLRHLTERLLPS